MKNSKIPITRQKIEKKILLSPIRVESAKIAAIRINAKKQAMKSNIERAFLVIKNRNKNGVIMEFMYLSLMLE